MRISLAILAAAANAAILDLNAVNEAILYANEAEVASETEKWEALLEHLFDEFQLAKNVVENHIRQTGDEEGYVSFMNYAVTCVELFSDPSKEVT